MQNIKVCAFRLRYRLIEHNIKTYILSVCVNGDEILYIVIKIYLVSNLRGYLSHQAIIYVADPI